MIDTIKLGKFAVGRRWLAPMAGYTDIAFRELCKSFGASVTVTEMVSVRGLVRDNAATQVLTRIADSEKPRCIQLFGNDPSEFARAAAMLDCDIIDINMGCPMPKIVKNGDGSALLNNPRLAGEIVRAVKNSTDKPITVKTRIGYKADEITAGELMAEVAAAGACAVTVHGRTSEQRYSGVSDMNAVQTLAQAVKLPVIYNGDVTGENIALAESKFAGVAIGRAALTNPAIFRDGRADAQDVARRHIRLLEKYFDGRYIINAARKFFVHYFKGVRGGKAVREAVNAAQSASDIYRALDAFERTYN